MFSNEITNATNTLISEHIKKLDSWLVRSEVYDSGAIAGSMDQNDHQLYTYPEIAGYYLSYLAYRLQHEQQNEQLIHYAQQVVKHQQSLWSRSEPPATRQYSQYSTVIDDWRNKGLFIFDVAMLWRGISDVAAQSGAPFWDAKELRVHVDKFLSDTRIKPVCWISDRPDNAPDRWSTRSGPYQLKVLAALRRAASFHNDQQIITTLNSVSVLLVNDFNQAMFDDHNPHSIAYAIEGALLLGEGFGIDYALAKNWVERLAKNINSPGVTDIDYRRSDAIAQLLRLSCCEPCFNPVLATKLYELLISTIQSDGSLRFTLLPCEISYKNTWPVLFARQALDFYEQMLTLGRPLSEREYTCIF